MRIARYAHLEFEFSALYLHREDFERMLLMHSVGLDELPLKPEFTALNDNYVYLEGVFRARREGLVESGADGWKTSANTSRYRVGKSLAGPCVSNNECVDRSSATHRTNLTPPRKSTVTS